MKKLLLCLLLTITVFCFGCTESSGIVKKSLSDTFNSKEMSMAYEGFNGYKKKTFKAESGDSISYDIKSTDGSICITVQNTETSEYLLNETTVDDISGTVNISDAAKYCVKITGIDHSGSFSVIINR